MSGRSAYVRKEKESEKKKKGNGASRHDHDHDRHDYNPPPVSMRRAAKSISSNGSDDLAMYGYARVKKPVLPDLEVSGIEKSTFREKMDKTSDGVRGKLAGMGFGKKKKKGLGGSESSDSRPQTSATIRPADHYEEMDATPVPTRTERNGNATAYAYPQEKNPAYPQGASYDDDHRPAPQPGTHGLPAPPTGKLPPLPPAPQLRRWTGNGRSPHPWNKLRKDPELWDPHGDTLIYLSQESDAHARPPPSFRVSSHVLEATESKFLLRQLREGYTDFYGGYEEEMPPSPVSSAGGYGGGYGVGNRGHGQGGHGARSQRGRLAPPLSPLTDGGSDGQISYELYFPAPAGLSKNDTLRYHVTTRNVFALLYQTSLVGLNLVQALSDLLDRLKGWMERECDCLEMVIDYLLSKHLHDPRSDPETAVSLLAWSESKPVRWREGWREFFVHCVGLHSRLESLSSPTSPSFSASHSPMKFVTPITKALLERAALEMEDRVLAVAARLASWDFADMWPAMTPHPPSERAAFERLRGFFRHYYESAYGGYWPPPSPSSSSSSESWLSREIVRRLQDDLGALYDYLVDRDVHWESLEERASRKWQMTSYSSGARGKVAQVDTPDLPMTDILVAFDNRHQYPHIPHPYPLVPASIPAKQGSSNRNGANGPKVQGMENKMHDRRLALAYTEATNIYILGADSSVVSNRLCDAFIQFEKLDKAASSTSSAPSSSSGSSVDIDPFAARRGRWVLIYGILQCLASVSVDVPGLRYTEGVRYHLSPSLRGTPPWKTAMARLNARGRRGDLDEEEEEGARHELSYCWVAPKVWASGGGGSGSGSGSGNVSGSGAESGTNSESEVPMLDSLTIGGGGGGGGGNGSAGSSPRTRRHHVHVAHGGGGAGAAGANKYHLHPSPHGGAPHHSHGLPHLGLFPGPPSSSSRSTGTLSSMSNHSSATVTTRPTTAQSGTSRAQSRTAITSASANASVRSSIAESTMSGSYSHHSYSTASKSPRLNMATTAARQRGELRLHPVPSRSERSGGGGGGDHYASSGALSPGGLNGHQKVNEWQIQEEESSDDIGIGIGIADQKSDAGRSEGGRSGQSGGAGAGHRDGIDRRPSPGIERMGTPLSSGGEAIERRPSPLGEGSFEVEPLNIRDFDEYQF